MSADDINERVQQDHAIRLALVEQQVAGVKEELHKISGSVDKINDSIGRLVWTVVLAVVVAGLNFALKGGFNA